MDEVDPRPGPYLKPGTKVRLDSRSDGVVEYGIVIHCWMDESIEAYDCHVALYENGIPEGKPDQRPEIYRYAALSLKVAE